MMGLDLNYQFNPNLMVGATIMHMSEMPLTTKTTMGDEAIKNTLWGVNMAYKGESQWLTNMFDKLPLLNLSKTQSDIFQCGVRSFDCRALRKQEHGWIFVSG